MTDDYHFMMPDDSFSSRLDRLKAMIGNAVHIVFFGGAGVSTESGIPDFRSRDGLYSQRFKNKDPEYLLSRECLNHEPKLFYEFYRTKLDCRNAEPNTAHKYLAELEKTKHVSIITQNIDGLHQMAGSSEVYEIHGSLMRNFCTKCRRRFDKDAIFNSAEPIPRCPDCGGTGFIRPDIVLYGEQLPDDFEKAMGAAENADLMIVAGTSLTVYPAAKIAEMFEEKLVIINKDITHMDSRADIVFHENIGSVFQKL